MTLPPATGHDLVRTITHLSTLPPRFAGTGDLAAGTRLERRWTTGFVPPSEVLRDHAWARPVVRPTREIEHWNSPRTGGGELADVVVARVTDLAVDVAAELMAVDVRTWDRHARILLTSRQPGCNFRP